MRLLIGVLASCLFTAAAHGQESLSGTWQGYWVRAGDSLPVTLTVERDSHTGRYAAAFSSDRLRVSGIPFSEVQVQGCCDVTLVLRGDRTTTQFAGRVHGDSFSGGFREGTSGGQFTYSRIPAAPASFEERPITFPSGAVTLAGSLLVPLTGDSLRAVVFLQGSGAEGRWASRYLAAQLASHGTAALIFDKRGVGGSSGDWRTATPDDLAGDGAAAVSRLRQEPRIDSRRIGLHGHSQGGTLASHGTAALIFDKRGVGGSSGDWRTATPDDLAGDGAAAVSRLRQEPRIDPRRIGLHGHSQGGTLAPLVAARSSGVAFVIGSAAAGVPTDSTERYSLLNSVYPEATSAADSAAAEAYVTELVMVAYHGKPRAGLDSLASLLRERPWFFAPPPAPDPYWSFSAAYARYKALDWWARVRVPVLLIYGAADQRVPAAESAARIASTLRAAGNADVTVRILPGADHTFRLPPGPSGWPVTAPDYIPTLLGWLARR